MGNHHLCEYNSHSVECVNSHKFANANTEIGGLATHLCMIHLAMPPSKKNVPVYIWGIPIWIRGLPVCKRESGQKNPYGDSLFAKDFCLLTAININAALVNPGAYTAAALAAGVSATHHK